MNDEVKDTRPPPPSWLDKDFIQTALRTGDEDPSITVLSCDIHFANAAGDGYASDMYRVTATLQDSQQRSVIVKAHPRGGMLEDMVNIWGAFDRETEMLTKTLPAMQKLLEQARPGEYPPFAAKCLYHGNDPIKFLVLEDLKQSGFTLAKRQNGVDLAHCSLAFKTLARFHASSIALLKQDPTALKYFDQSVYSEELRGHLAPYHNSFLLSLTNEVAQWPGYEKYADKLKIVKETYYDCVMAVLKRKEDEFNVLIHGDPWTSNMMFKYSDDGVADLRLVDFQTVHYSSPAVDLQYFLYICPTEEVRINHLDSLLQEYHNTLTEILNILGCNDKIISLQELRKTFRDHAFFGFFASISDLPVILSDPKDGFDMGEALKSNGEETETHKKLHASESYKKVMKRLLPLFEENGLL